MRAISGVAVPAVPTVGDTSFAEAALFTHKGLSGPADPAGLVLLVPGRTRHVDVLPGAAAKLRDARARLPRRQLKTALAVHLPKRLADVLADRIALSTELGNASDATLDAVARHLTHLTLHPTGTEGYAKAEVTAGGIDTAALSSRRWRRAPSRASMPSGRRWT